MFTKKVAGDGEARDGARRHFEGAVTPIRLPLAPPLFAESNQF